MFPLSCCCHSFAVPLLLAAFLGVIAANVATEAARVYADLQGDASNALGLVVWLAVTGGGFLAGRALVNSKLGPCPHC